MRSLLLRFNINRLYFPLLCLAVLNFTPLPSNLSQLKSIIISTLEYSSSEHMSFTTG
jgi:hypothetical protein